MMADSTDNKSTTVKNEDDKLTTPPQDGKTSTSSEPDQFKGGDHSDDGTGNKSSDDKSPLEPTQNEEKRELSDFEAAAEEGRKTAERNLAAEEKENGDAEPGAENKTAKVTTSEAQPQLKPADEKGNVTAKKEDERLGDDKAAQKPNAALRVGQKTAAANLKTEESDQPEGQEDGTTYNQAIDEGLSTAQKNHRAEVAANKAANQRR